MAIVLTNGEFYIKTSNTGSIQKTANIEEAQTFYSCNVAMKKVFRAPSKCSGYYPFDTEDITCRIGNIKKRNGKKQKREKYSIEQRKIIYDKANGRCALCGKKIKIEDMSLDHIFPLSMGGADSMDNLQCTCRADNEFKRNILPDTFIDRITQIFLYQMERKYGHTCKWKIANALIKTML